MIAKTGGIFICFNQEVLEGEGFATEKIDGSCCVIIDGVFYKRYDAKQ